MNVRWLERSDIDEKRWDRCVDSDPSGLIYAKSGYLDILCQNMWSGLVLDHYDAVMALPYNRKIFGYPQVYTPFFCQQLGLYGNVIKNRERVGAFIAAIPFSFRKVAIHMKADNALPGHIQFEQRQNLILELKGSIDDIRENYSTAMEKNLKSAWNSMLKYRVAVRQEDLEKLFLSYYWPRSGGLKSWGFDRFKRYLRKVVEGGWGELHAVYDEEGTLLAGGLLLTSEDRTINAITATSERGRKENATHFMLDSAISARLGSSRYFDFEGSHIPGVAKFYKQFGAVEETYNLYKENSLPEWVNALVKLKRRWGF